MADNSQKEEPKESEPRVPAAKPKPRISDLLVITGHIHQLREWSERLDDIYIYETMGTVVALFEPYLTRPRNGPFSEAILVIKDKVRMGPTFKVIYPMYDRPLPSHITVGSMLRIVGKLVNKYSMRAIKVTRPTNAEIRNFDRITHVCYNRIMKYLNDPPQ